MYDLVRGSFRASLATSLGLNLGQRYQVLFLLGFQPWVFSHLFFSMPSKTGYAGICLIKSTHLLFYSFTYVRLPWIERR